MMVCSNDDLGLPLTYFMARSNFYLGFYIEKCDSDRLFGNYCSLLPGNWLIYLKLNEGIQGSLDQHYIDILGPDIR